MNCEIISKIKPEVTSPIPSCRRGTITTQGHAHILSSPYRGSQRGSQGRETSKADYNSISEVTEDEVLEMAPLSHEFVDSLKPLLAKQKSS